MNYQATVFQKLHLFLASKATTKVVLAALGFYLLSLLALNFYDIQLVRAAPGVAKPDLTFGYTPAVITEIFASFGAEGRQIYLLNLLVDSFMPVFFALAVLLVVARVIPRWLGLLSIAPLTFMILDLIENASFALMVTQYPSISTALVSVTSVITMVKLSAYLIALPTLVLTYAGWIVGSLIRWRSLILQKR